MAFIETVNSLQPYLALPIQRMSSNISLVFSNILFGTNCAQSLQDRIKGWPSPWFLSVDRLNMSVKLAPCPLPFIPSLTRPDATDRPPDPL